MKKCILLFFIFNSILLFAQESIKTPLVYLNCKKVENKGNGELIKCFKENFWKDFHKMVSMELRSRKLTTNYLLKAEFNFVFDENGKISISNFEGSEDTKDILEKSLFRLNERIRGGKYKIIAAKNNDGQFIETTIKVPFKYAFVRS